MKIIIISDDKMIFNKNKMIIYQLALVLVQLAFVSLPPHCLAWSSRRFLHSAIAFPSESLPPATPFQTAPRHVQSSFRRDEGG